jgi:hypothetical protein
MRSWAITARTLTPCVLAACAALACGEGDPSPAPPALPVEPEPFEGEGNPWITPAPRAACRGGDKPETGLQGLGTDVQCNLDIKGQVDVEQFLSFAWYEDCAYANSPSGTTVIDVSDVKRPKVVTKLTTPGMLNSWESMKVHEGRGLLVGYQSASPILDVYDVATDCKAPVLKSSFNLGGSGHAGNFSPDGTIYYASAPTSERVFAVDITDPGKPRVITSDFDRTAHDVFIGKNGKRAYFAFSNPFGIVFMGMVAILDVSQIQARAAGARGVLIHETAWPDGWATQYPLAITFRGRDHLLITDELGSGGQCLDPQKPPFGYARILDIHDERNPTLVSKIKTEAQDPANCKQATAATAGLSFGVSAHYCNVDRTDDPRLLSCGFWAGGVRLFDIRNPWQPKEVAYFNVPGTEVAGLTRIRGKQRELWVSTNKTFYVLGLPEEVGGIFGQ